MRPRDARVVTCSCCWKVDRYPAEEIFKGEPKPSAGCAALRQDGTKVAHSKMDGALRVAASLIAAVQLNKEEICNTPIVRSAIGQTIQLARMIWATIESVGR